MTNTNIIIHNLISFVHKNQRSSLLSPAHGKGGASATISFLSAPPPPEKTLSGFQQAGKKEGGLGEGIFARLLSAEGAAEVGSSSSLRQQGSKARKNYNV